MKDKVQQQQLKPPPTTTTTTTSPLPPSTTTVAKEVAAETAAAAAEIKYQSEVLKKEGQQLSFQPTETTNKEELSSSSSIMKCRPGVTTVTTATATTTKIKESQQTVEDLAARNFQSHSLSSSSSSSSSSNSFPLPSSSLTASLPKSSSVFLSRYQIKALPNGVSPSNALRQVVLPTSLSRTFEPGMYDVVCGRGKGSYNREGNKRFRDIVQQSVHEYVNAKTKFDKSIVLSSIVDRIRCGDDNNNNNNNNKGECGGRFVKYTPKDGWVEVGDDQARDKAGHAMREAVASLLDPLLSSSSSSTPATTAAGNSMKSNHNNNNNNNNKNNSSQQQKARKGRVVAREGHIIVEQFEEKQLELQTRQKEIFENMAKDLLSSKTSSSNGGGGGRSNNKK